MCRKEEEIAAYLFHQGTNYFAQCYLGCQVRRSGACFLYTFRTWAPGATRVSLLSDFTDWDEGMPMQRVTAGGIFCCEFRRADSLTGCAYKYRISSSRGDHNKGDPYARESRGGADGASVVPVAEPYLWGDDGWLSERARKFSDPDLPCPLNIYEVHFGSFLRDEQNRPMTYRQAPLLLLPYVKRMGYTHVEFLPLMEHPYDGSWGYQIGAYFAPAHQFGSPTDFHYMVDAFHRAGVGVILDWVPAHFPKDEWGLYEFDGSPLYEYQGRDRQESACWGTRFFDVGREEVQCFLISNALYWIEEYHIDGLRADAVASMLYLDYDRLPGEWIPNEKGGRENLEAIAFFRKLSEALCTRHPDVLLIAEESTAFAGVSASVRQGGLGFTLKWNMGFANDLFAYLALDPIYRQYHHTALNFPIVYAFSERFILPISHDEVVHGKQSFIGKIYGCYEDKFRQARVALLMLMSYPGKKMLFMGTEFAQFREWDYSASLEWFMNAYPAHAALHEYVRALNLFYLACPALWERDFSPEGFSWVSADEAQKNLVAFCRHARRESVFVILSFSGCAQSVYIPLPPFHALAVAFASSADSSDVTLTTEQGGIRVTLAPFCGAVLRQRDTRILFECALTDENDTI